MLDNDSIEIMDIVGKGLTEVEIRRKNKVSRLLDCALDKIQEVIDDPDLDNFQKLNTAQTALGAVNIVEKLGIEKRKIIIAEAQFELEKSRLPPAISSAILIQSQSNVTINSADSEAALLERKRKQDQILNSILGNTTANNSPE